MCLVFLKRNPAKGPRAPGIWDPRKAGDMLGTFPSVSLMSVEPVETFAGGWICGDLHFSQPSSARYMATSSLLEAAGEEKFPEVFLYLTFFLLLLLLVFLADKRKSLSTWYFFSEELKWFQLPERVPSTHTQPVASHYNWGLHGWMLLKMRFSLVSGHLKHCCMVTWIFLPRPGTYCWWLQTKAFFQVDH